MATVKLRFMVDELSNVMTQFDVIKVYRADVRDGTYVEITGPATRVPLVVGTVQYEYIDSTAPSASYWYRTSFYHTVTSLESSMSLPIQGTDPGLYVSLQDLRDEGITTTELSDERALSLIRGWQSWIEKMTAQFFTPKELTLDFDGNGTRLLQLPVPIIEVTNLYINGDFANVVDPACYTVYNRRGPVTDDRRNPRIKLKTAIGTSIFGVTYTGTFALGDLNQRIEGRWGYVEPDDTTPIPVKRAVMILVNLTKEFLPDGDIDQLRVGRVIEEVTDRHRITYADLYDRLGVWSPTGIAEVDFVLRSYRSPQRIDATRYFSVV